MKGQMVVFTKKDPKGPRFSTIFLSLKLTKIAFLYDFSHLVVIFVVLFCLLERRRKVVFIRKFSLYVQFTSLGRNSELLTYKVLV